MILEVMFALLISLIGLGSIYPLLDRTFNNLPKQIKNPGPTGFSCSLEGARPPYLLKNCTEHGTENKTLVITSPESGNSLLEILIGISLSLVVLSFLCKTYGVVSLQSRAIRSWMRDAAISDRVAAEITRLFEATDSHTFNYPPRVHPTGQILLRSGKNNAVVTGTSKLKPSIHSSALTNFKPSLSLLSDIKTCSASGNRRFGRSCLRYANSGASSDFQSFLMVSLEGAFEGDGVLRGSGKCKEFDITLGESMLFDSPLVYGHCNERLIVPLHFIQTIYQSQSGDFRLVSHRLDRNVENQPLTLTQGNMRLLLELNSNNLPWILNYNITSLKKNLATRSLLSHLGRENFDNLILNIL